MESASQVDNQTRDLFKLYVPFNANSLSIDVYCWTVTCAMWIKFTLFQSMLVLAECAFHYLDIIFNFIFYVLL